jgi:hypothetical protein
MGRRCLVKELKMASTTEKPMAEITGIWLRRIGRKCELLIESRGSWRRVPILSGSLGSGVDNFPASEIIEMTSFAERFPLDEVTK